MVNVWTYGEKRRLEVVCDEFVVIKAFGTILRANKWGYGLDWKKEQLVVL